MEIKCTPQELKELIENKKETTITETIDVSKNAISSKYPLKNQLFGQQI